MAKDALLVDDISTPLDGLDGGSGLQLASRVFVASNVAPDAPLVFCFPGGGYSMTYFDPVDRLDESYSMARYFARSGVIVATTDHLGVGRSSRPSPSAMTTDLVVAAAALVVETVREMVAVPRAQFTTIGLGHSMAGAVLTMQQASHASFDALVLHGWSARQTFGSEVVAGRAGIASDGPGVVPDDVPPGYAVRSRGAPQRYCYYYDDVPSDVIAADTQSAVAIPPCLSQMNDPGVVAEDARRIKVPVFVAKGERDLFDDLDREASAYPGAKVTTYLLARSGHCHNLSSSRQLLWDRTLTWCQRVAR